MSKYTPYWHFFIFLFVFRFFYYYSCYYEKFEITSPNLAHRYHNRMDLPPPSTPPISPKGRRKVPLGRRYAFTVENPGEDDFFFFVHDTFFFPWERGERWPFSGRLIFFRPFGCLVQARAGKNKSDSTIPPPPKQKQRFSSTIVSWLLDTKKDSGQKIGHLPIKPHPFSILRVPTTQLAKMSIDL